jgi:hypothetical protein
MGGLRYLRACVTTSAVVALAMAGMVSDANPASAGPQIVTCTSLSGTLDASPITFDLGGCSGNTGGSGIAEGTTITWHNGQTTYLSTPAFSLPGGKPKRGNCTSLADKWAIRDTVAGDTTGSIHVGRKVSASVCILNQAPDPWSLAPKSAFTLR